MKNNKKSNINNKANKNSKNNKKKNEYIFTYSGIEQKRHGMSSPGKCLYIFIGIFPFIPLILELVSCFVTYLDSRKFKMWMFILSSILVIWLFVQIFIFINRIFHVLMIDENGVLYRLKISNFWYKIKNQTILLNPMGTSGGRLLRLFYMINNIKLVLQNISDTVTYEELIAMGKLEKFSEISDVIVNKKNICFNAKVKSASGERIKKVKIARVYENDFQIISYLKGEDYSKPELMSKIMEELHNAKTSVKKMINFSINWICIMAWISVILLSSDLGKLSKINAGIYKESVIEIEKNDKITEIEVYISDSGDYFKKSEYGNLYKPVFVVFFSVEIIYLVSKATDILIDYLKKDEKNE